MPRLKNAHTEVVVNVDDTFADRLRGAGWVDADSKKASAKKPSSSKSEK